MNGLKINLSGAPINSGITLMLNPPLSQSDIEKILTQFGDIGSFMGQFLPMADSIPGFSDLITVATKGLTGFDANASTLGETADGNYTISFALPDQSTMTFIVGSDILTRLSAGQTDYLLAIDYLPSPDQFASLYADTPFEGLIPLNTEIVASNRIVDSALDVGVQSGISLITQFDIAGSKSRELQFAHDYLGIAALNAVINVDQHHQSFTGEIALDRQVSMGELGITFNGYSYSIGFQDLFPLIHGVAVDYAERL